jgi:hypothetical protein
MRTLLLAAGCLLTFASRGPAEFDAGPAKPMQAAGATFGDGMAATRATGPAQNRELILDSAAFIRIAGMRGELLLNQVNRFRTPRTHRPANIPTRPYDEIIISTDGCVRFPNTRAK